jgi:hypothetical protein
MTLPALFAVRSTLDPKSFRGQHCTGGAAWAEQDDDADRSSPTCQQFASNEASHRHSQHRLASLQSAG